MIIRNTEPDTYPTRVLQDDELTLGERVEFNDEYEAEVDDDVGEQLVNAVEHFEEVEVTSSTVEVTDSSSGGDTVSISTESEPEESEE